MPIVAVDDTDSRERGMCTTYVGARLAERLAAAGGRVERRFLVRLNPAVKHKTRGNAAVAIHVDEIDAADAFEIGAATVREFAVPADPRTSPGLVVAPVEPAAVPTDVAAFARRALRHRLTLDEAASLAEAHGYRHAAFGTGGAGLAGGAGDADDPIASDIAEGGVPGRGRIGALAAVGALAAFDDWTVEHIAYRDLVRCGTPRDVDAESVFAAADAAYPTVWDTVDRATGEIVCVPNAPGPILYGIRGDDAAACREVAASIESEAVARTETFMTNQGTDAHLAAGDVGDLRDGAGYRVDGVVASDPETRRGGHVHVDVAAGDDGSSADTDSDGDDDDDGNGGDASDDFDGDDRIRCVAFEPTGRFRDHVRALRPGDRVTVCGEHEWRALPGRDEESGTLKLEKIAVRGLVRTERAVPTCSECGRSMSSAGKNQGYRCRRCGTGEPEKVEREVDRAIETGWYEVPPSARRHVAKPLVRGGFDAPVHPER
ncbi:tRNA(Ile)(2)-agmatinylcytidine synthase [Halorubrum laminariae]|uniref:tRNA(Ile2) 2-agmatinylcytidine synthetase TiaS n=1 Tax=Halorubrum laminariae TaxID=1433523 RepID=A0ABD6BZB4_9EURY|nr:tRNA(Ile)(2)-agmatinylcytidine synthase [Halorubrum laminariae]